MPKPRMWSPQAQELIASLPTDVREDPAFSDVMHEHETDWRYSLANWISPYDLDEW